MPCIKKPQLRDAQKLHQENAMFEVPSNDRLKAIKVGDYVKVNHSSERFWVKIVSCLNDTSYTGKIENNLIQRGLKLGDVILLTARNVYQIDTDQ